MLSLIYAMALPSLKMSYDVCHLLVGEDMASSPAPRGIYKPPDVYKVRCVIAVVLVATLEKQENIANEKCN